MKQGDDQTKEVDCWRKRKATNDVTRRRCYIYDSAPIWLQFDRAATI